MPNSVDSAARAVIERLATDNPGHQSLGWNDVAQEVAAFFPEMSEDNRERLASEVLERIYRLVPVNNYKPAYSAVTGERLCLQIYPVIWPHTPDEI